ncbi:OmpA family protein [Algiphilus sp.]|uniref:OmpA family protein n=1 Tax=Algiphilus sp. TaxID=1872431 RepID=UPI003B51917F
MNNKILSFVILAGFVGMAGANELGTSPHYLNVMGHYIVTDDERGAEGDGSGFLTGYGYRFNPNLSLELQFVANQHETDAGPFTDFYQYGGGADLMYRFIGHDGVDPFIIAGIGGVYDDVLPDSEDSFNFQANAGLGLLSQALTEAGLRLRLEGRYLYNTFDYQGSSTLSDWRIGAGLLVPIGSKVIEREVVRERVVTETKTVQADIVDSDGDGVPDRNDQCPDTLQGLATDSRGCASQKPQVVRLKGVHFELDSAQLKPGARSILRDVADSLKGEPNMRVEIAGHTDSQGSAAYNLNLSQRRASAVKTFLINQGIDPTRMDANGYGESRPVASNETAAGRQENRRVEFKVLN